MKEQFSAKMLSIHFTEADKWDGKPLHEALVHLCHEQGLFGAIVYRGIEGFGASARIYHARSLSISKHAPVMATIIGKEDQIQKILLHLDRMIDGGLVVSSAVDVIHYSKSGESPSATK